MKVMTEIFETAFHSKFTATVVLLASMLAFRHVALRLWARKEGLQAKIRRGRIGTIRNLTLLLAAAGMAIIWSVQLRAITATFMLVAVAIVLATKEYFLNLTGFLFRSSTNFFAVGDRIETGDIKGDVIDQSFLGITAMEISANHLYTGRAVFIPNLKFLSATVKNESYTKDYIFHFVTIPVKNDEDWVLAREALREAGDNVCRPFLSEARKHMKTITDRYNLDVPRAEPKVYMRIPKPDQIDLTLRVPIPSRRRGRLEQEITEAYLHALRRRRNAGQEDSVPDED